MTKLHLRMRKCMLPLGRVWDFYDLLLVEYINYLSPFMPFKTSRTAGCREVLGVGFVQLDARHKTALFLSFCMEKLSFWVENLAFVLPPALCWWDGWFPHWLALIPRSDLRFLSRFSTDRCRREVFRLCLPPSLAGRLHLFVSKNDLCAKCKWGGGLLHRPLSWHILEAWFIGAMTWLRLLVCRLITFPVQYLGFPTCCSSVVNCVGLHNALRTLDDV